MHPCVRLLFATASFAQSTGIRSDTVFCTPLRRACGASCIRLELFSRKSLGHSPEGEVKKSDNFFWGVKRAVLGLPIQNIFLSHVFSFPKTKALRSRHAGADTRRSLRPIAQTHGGPSTYTTSTPPHLSLNHGRTHPNERHSQSSAVWRYSSHHGRRRLTRPAPREDADALWDLGATTCQSQRPDYGSARRVGRAPVLAQGRHRTAGTES